MKTGKWYGKILFNICYAIGIPICNILIDVQRLFNRLRHKVARIYFGKTKYYLLKVEGKLFKNGG